MYGSQLLLTFLFYFYFLKFSYFTNQIWSQTILNTSEKHIKFLYRRNYQLHDNGLLLIGGQVSVADYGQTAKY